ncbi:LapA family protein [Cohaesibacter sp. CAU 1516]|uniref:lipopolysaccharide assembly protein LapA domain-containing protein n=1 Tax=Cohaesibacter sp. CAU 1516 TaxID=2576038 RepID=UPI0010FEA905|nr:LapA family protein [Cohaesibacter sp. CAU 1516]TLP46061.1 LapA family protein [Cohaesibacter sp. CAU 1516]
MKAIKRLFQLLILVPVGIVLVSLAVANRHSVNLALDPFSPEQPALDFSVPLYVVMFGSLLVGILIGGFMAWMKQGRHRRTAREKRYEARKWRNEADRQQKRVEKLTTLPQSDAPALPAPSDDNIARPAA